MPSLPTGSATSEPCTCKPIFPPVKSITAPSSTTVQLDLAAPDGALKSAAGRESELDRLPDRADRAMGEKAFEMTPGRRRPVHGRQRHARAELGAEANPSYWQKGVRTRTTSRSRPWPATRPRYEAMLAGQGQAYDGMVDPLARTRRRSTSRRPSSPRPRRTTFSSTLDLRRSTTSMARRGDLLRHRRGDHRQSCSATSTRWSKGSPAPGGLFYEPNVPGYPSYDLAKAKALVKQLGGLTVNLFTIGIPVTDETTRRCRRSGRRPESTASIHAYGLAALIGAVHRRQVAGGAADGGLVGPGRGSRASGSGSRPRRRSAACTTRSSTRCSTRRQARSTQRPATRLRGQAAKYIARMAYGPFLFSAHRAERR